MRDNLIVAIIIVVALFSGCFIAVNYANAAETSTLDSVVERRPPGVNKFVDKKNSVVCYWKGESDKIDCVYIPRDEMISRGAK